MCDDICACGHGHDASHEPDGTCLRVDCGCLNDGANICQARYGGGMSAPRCQKVAPHDGHHLHADSYGTTAWGFTFGKAAS